MSSAPVPFVTVAMPCLNEERHIEACLRGALAQDYPADHLEVLVADGGSTDATRTLVRRIAAEDPRVALVDNPGRLQSAGMNEAIRRARGDVVVRMDVHAEYAPDYVRRSVEVLERTGADNVGGAARTRSGAPFQQAVCAALASPLGVGGSRYRNPENEGFVESVFNGAFRRSVFETVGLYDPHAVTNEDAELNQRIHEAGGRVYLSREVVVHYLPRDRMGALARQYFKYGQGRARTTLKHRRLLSIRPVVPFLMVLAGAVLVVTPALHGLAPWALGAYAALALLEAVRVGRRGGLRQVLTVWSIFPVLHVCHGLGFAAGLLRYARRPDWSEPERLSPRAPAPASAAAPAAAAQAASGARAAGAGGEERPMGDRAPVMNWKVRVAKRVIDVVFSGLLLLLVAPALPLIALAVKLDSPGPVFYRQRRAGAFLGTERKDGREELRFVLFEMPKFRTMCVDAEKGTGVVIAAKRDPRVTRVGKVLRRTRLDELPQLWSILRGHMSLVGPRPERPELIRDLALAIPMFEERMRGVKPGLTGFAQINLGYAGDPLPGSDIYALRSALTNPFKIDGAEGAIADDMRIKLLYDLAYSAVLDDLRAYLLTEMEIILKTPLVMLRGLGR